MPIFLAMIAVRKQSRVVTFRSAEEMLDAFGMQQDGSRYHDCSGRSSESSSTRERLCRPRKKNASGLFEEHERNKTPEDIRVEELEDENDERYLAELYLNEPSLPIEELWKA